MSLQDIQQKILDFRYRRNWQPFHTPKNLSMSIAIEAAELMECYQWTDTPKPGTDPIEELADVLIYCINLADILDLDIEQIILNKLAKNEHKYPVVE